MHKDSFKKAIRWLINLKEKYKIYEVDVLFKKRKYGEAKGGGSDGSI